MERQGIVQSCGNLLFREILLYFFPFLDSDHIQMIDGFRPGRLKGPDDPLDFFKKSVVAIRTPATTFVPFGKALELYIQDSGLYRVKPAVIPFHVMVIFLHRTMVTQNPNLSRDLLIVRCNRSPFSTGAEVLPGIKTESRSLTHRSGPFPTSLQL